MILYSSYSLILAYGLMVVVFYIGSKMLRNKRSEQTALSVIVPFRNEEDRIEPFIASLNRAKFSGLEIEFLFVDDDSEDETVSYIEQNLSIPVAYKIVKNQSEGKKGAIETAVKLAKNEQVLLLDADVYFEKGYFSEIAQVIGDNDCTILPVRLVSESNKLLVHFDVLEFQSLQSATFGSAGFRNYILSNGANFAFKKSAFEQVNGYQGTLKTHSGDDVFLLKKMSKAGKKIRAVQLSEVMVSTPAIEKIKDLLSQRIRWSSKTMAIKNWWVFVVGGITLTVNWAVLYWSAKLIFSDDRLHFLGLIFCKIALDYFLILQNAKKYQLGNSKYYIPALTFIYPFYLMLLFPMSLIKNPLWKGRKTKI